MHKLKISSFLVSIFLLSGCGDGHQERNDGMGSSKNQEVGVPYKVSRDLEAIKEDGVLHAITIYNSTSYFLYRGMPMGFEYELLSRLAKDLGLKLKITIAEDID